MIIDQINKDIVVAAKSGFSEKRDILRLLKGTLDQSGNASDDDVFSTIKKLVKSNCITMESMESTSSKDTWSVEWKESYEKLSRENEILNNYLPKELDRVEIVNIVTGLNIKIAKSSGQALGIAMKHFKINSLAVNADVVKSVVEEVFNG